MPEGPGGDVAGPAAEKVRAKKQNPKGRKGTGNMATRNELETWWRLGDSLGISRAVLNAACSSMTMSTGGKVKKGLPTDNAEKCPECGGNMVNGECEDCGYEVRNANGGPAIKYPMVKGSAAPLRPGNAAPDTQDDDHAPATLMGQRGDGNNQATTGKTRDSRPTVPTDRPTRRREDDNLDADSYRGGGGVVGNARRGDDEETCPECGGQMRDGECEDCGYTENANNQALNQGDPSMWDFTGNMAGGDTFKGAIDAGYSPSQAAAMTYKDQGEYTGDKESSAGKASAASQTAKKASGEAKEKGTAGAHRKAAYAHREAQRAHKEENNPGTAQRHKEAGDYHFAKAAGQHGNKQVGNMGRHQLLRALSVNCSTQRDRQALGMLSDGALRSLLTNAGDDDASFSSTRDGKPITPGGDRRIGELDEDDDADDDDYTDYDDVGATPKKDKVTMSANASFRMRPMGDRLTANERAVLDRAVQAEAQQKYAMVREIVANIADEEERQGTGNEMMAFDLPKVQRLHRAFLSNNPQPTGNAFGMSSPLYFGDGVLNRGQPVHNAEVLDLEAARKTYDPQYTRNREEQGITDTA